GDGVVKRLVTRLQHDFQYLLLLNGVTDLHGTAGNGPGCLIHFHAGKGGPAQAVAAGAAANRHDEVAWLSTGRMGATRQYAQAAAVDEGVGGVARVIIDSPAHGGNPHLVA